MNIDEVQPDTVTNTIAVVNIEKNQEINIELNYLANGLLMKYSKFQGDETSPEELSIMGNVGNMQQIALRPLSIIYQVSQIIS